MKQTGLLLDTLFCEHDPGEHHPEASGRIQAICRRLGEDDLIARCQSIEPREVTDDEVLLCHTESYWKTVLREIDGKNSGVLSTGDTSFGPKSLEVARRASGGVLRAVDAVIGGKVKNAFCAVRPPGHHATADRGMGFCIWNNVAIAARYSQEKYGIGRIAIVDWDVHHGNGTQDLFYEDGSVFYFSTHQYPWYPGTGSQSETGRGKGAGATLNVPLPAGSGMERIGAAFQNEFTSKMKDFKPDLVILSAGFDSRNGDPLGQFTLNDRDFVDLTEILIDLAGEFAGGKLISVLEGGYNQSGLASAVSCHLAALLKA